MSALVKKLVEKVSKARADHVAVVRLDGPIGAVPGRGGLSADSVESVLRRAFDTEHLKAVALVINSPGGSPTQSEYISERIRQLAAEKDVPVLAFCEDVAASGGYWIACAGDEIFAAHTSLVGSIGVVSSGFGLADVLSRFGVERRLYSAGENKVRLDTFSPERPDDVAWLESLQASLHEEFKAWVRRRREGKLTAAHDELFNGDVWIGTRAVELGLVDRIGVLRSVIAERYPDAEIVKIDIPKPLLARLTGGQVSVARLTEGVVGGAAAAVEKLPSVRMR